MSSDKNRVVILFGAGAISTWNGPSTASLTELIKTSTSSFLCNDNSTKVTEFIFNKLKSSGYSNDQINFETIINIIEELIIYYSYYNNKEELPSMHKVFFSSRFEDLISNFSIKGGVKKHNYELEIPKGKEYNFSQSSVNNESPEQFYFQHLLNELLTNINTQVSHYSYHTQKVSKIFQNENEVINNNFQSWLKNIVENSIVRMYTLNYDRLFKVLAERAGISVFDGFDCGEYVLQRGILPNVRQILSDFESNIHYNLHGSTYWNVYPRDPLNQLLSPYIALHPSPQLNINEYESSFLQMEKGKNILISNIITGFQKTQKSFITPFKQMHAAFDKDCCFANELIIIGYSFGDSHINSSIKSAIRNNPNLKLHFIDPAYSEKESNKGYELLINRLIDIFPEILNEGSQPLYSNNGETCTYFNNKLKVSSIGFERFLSNITLNKHSL